MKFLGQKLGLAEAGPKIFSFIDHPYNDVKEAALEACIALGGQVMMQRFVDLLDDADPIHRLMAVYAVGKMGGKEQVELLRRALEDESYNFV